MCDKWSCDRALSCFFFVPFSRTVRHRAVVFRFATSLNFIVVDQFSSSAREPLFALESSQLARRRASGRLASWRQNPFLVAVALRLLTHTSSLSLSLQACRPSLSLSVARARKHTPLHTSDISLTGVEQTSASMSYTGSTPMGAGGRLTGWLAGWRTTMTGRRNDDFVIV